MVNKWETPPWLIYENDPGQYANAFDGFYAWIQGWATDGSNWGEQSLTNFYQTMQSKYADKIIVGGVWASFDDSKASWGLNRHISARCGQTFTDTFNLWKKYYRADDPIPFLLVETWNDYEEGSAIERGIAGCGSGSQQNVLPESTGRERGCATGEALKLLTFIGTPPAERALSIAPRRGSGRRCSVPALARFLPPCHGRGSVRHTLRCLPIESTTHPASRTLP